jgi:hypothetical protein
MTIGATMGVRTLTSLSYESVAATSIVVGSGGPPPNYNPCAPSNPILGLGDNYVSMNSTTAPDISPHNCGTTYKANYFKFVPPVSGPYYFGACSQSAEHGALRVSILAGCATNSTVLWCNMTCDSQVTLPANQAVYCVVGLAAAGTPLPSPCHIYVASPNLPECLAATVAVFGDNAFDNSGSTAWQDVQSDAANTTTAKINKARFFLFTPGTTGAYSFSLCGATGDTMLAIGNICTGYGMTISTMAFNDDSCQTTPPIRGQIPEASFIDATNGGATGPTAGFPLTQNLISNFTYLIIAGSYTAQTSITGNLKIDGPAQPIPCLSDLNQDHIVNGADLGLLLGAWGTCPSPCTADLNNNGIVDGADLGLMLGAWGACPP